jgi:SAM-dependent methyltransferase
VQQTALTERLEQVAREQGPWGDNLLLEDGVYTISGEVTLDQQRLALVARAAADALGRPLEGARVLDIGAAEGLYAIELARHGAEVVALEGRRTNVEKANFLKETLGLENLQIVQDDVRNITREAYGEFDLVLCLGILYHLDGPAAVRLVHATAEVCRRVAVVDTHISFAAKQSLTVDGRTYAGRSVREFDAQASADEQERLSRSSIGNPESMWLTRPSLYNLLGDAGFTSVMEVRVPRDVFTSDRVTLIGFRGGPLPLLSAPKLDERPARRWPERETARAHSSQGWRAEATRRLAPLAPAGVKEWVRRRRGASGPKRSA